MDDMLTRAISWVKRHVFMRTDHVAESAGAADKGRPILTDSNGQIDATLLAAATLLAKLLTVDGAGSGLDADKLDGSEGSAYQLASGYTAADVLTKLLTVDGAGSGLDADLLDSLHATAFALLAGRSGGQTLYGGTAAGDDLYLRPTSHATKGDVIADQGNMGIGTAAPERPLHVHGTYNDPASSGTQPTGVAAFSVGETFATLYIGDAATSPYPVWLQASGSNDLSVEYDLALNPNGGKVAIGILVPTISDGVGLHIGGKILRLDTSKSPASNGTGNVGEICWDSNYLYVCTASNTWKRVALTGGY